MRKIITFLACFAFASAAAGCSRSGDYCDAKCECEGCSDREYDECLIDRDYEEDRADVYGCADFFAMAHDCTMQNNNCTSIPGTSIDVFGPEAECSDEWIDLADCIDDGSALF